MYIITNDKPHYPEIIYRIELKDAEEVAKQMIIENSEPDGKYAVKVIIAEIHSEWDIKTHY